MDKRYISNFLKGLASSSFGSGISIAMHFVSIMIIVKQVPKDEFGLYILILAITNFLRILSGLGLDLTLVKFIAGAEENQERQKIFTSILAIRLLTIIGVCGLIWAGGHIAAEAYQPALAEYVIYLPLLFAVMGTRELVFHLFQALRFFKKYAIVQVCSAIAKLLLILALMSQGELSLLTLIYVEIITLTASFILQIFLLPRSFYGKLQLQMSVFKDAVKFGFPLYLNNMLNFFHYRVSIFIMGIMLTPASIAYYEVAMKIPEGFSKLFNSFIIVYFPNLSQLFSQKKTTEAARVMNMSIMVLAFGGMFLVLGAFLFRIEIITLIFSETYLDSANGLVLLMLALYFKLISWTMGYSIVSSGDSSAPVKLNTIGNIVNIAANLALLPLMGFMGAIYAMLGVNALLLILNHIYLLRRKIYPDTRKYIMPAAWASILVSACLIWPAEAFYAKALVLAVYLVAGYLFYPELREGASRLFIYFRNLMFKPV